MSVWYTSDHHFGHSNIIRYCERPFSFVGEMNEAMVERWNERISADDEVWVLGDVVMGSNHATLRRHVARLRGHKILVPGNHDRCWAHKGNHVKARDAYYKLGGFEDIVDNPDPHTIGSHSVKLDHFPYRLDPKYDQKYQHLRPVDDGSWLLHGHIHQKWRQKGRQINVGVDVWDYAPVSSDEIANLIAAGPNNLCRHGERLEEVPLSST